MVGDLTPDDMVRLKYSDGDKHALEADGLMRMVTTLGDESIAAEITSLWSEYETQSTPESVIVKQFDKVGRLLT